MISDGNPEVLCPKLMERLGRFERYEVANYYGRRLLEVGRGHPNYPDDEDPTSVARRALLQGTFVTRVGYAFPAILGGAVSLAFVGADKGRPIATVVFGACLVVVATLLALWWRRAQEIRRFFENFSPAPATPSVPATESTRADRRGWLVAFASVDVIVMWALWFAFGFPAAIPSVFTIATISAVVVIARRMAQVTK